MNRKTNKKNLERGNLGSNPKTTVCKERLKNKLKISISYKECDSLENLKV